MSRGFYKTAHPVSSDYTDRVVIEIALPHGSTELRKRILGGLVFFFGKLGIHHSGHTAPADALRINQELNARRETAS